MKLGAIAQALSATVVGDVDLDVRRVVHPNDAQGRDDLAVALSKDALAAGGAEKAGAVLIGPSTPPPGDGRSAIVYRGHERVALAVLTALFDPGPAHAPGVHASAVVARDAEVGPSASIGPRTVVGSRSRVGEGTVLLANVSVGADVRIGSGCVVHPGVVINDRVTIGDRVILHANAVIGADGFSFIPVRNVDGSAGAQGLPGRVHSLGGVIIGDDVEIGALTAIDRGTLRSTRIGRGTKIDNHVQIGHNVSIGEACLIAGQAGIAGSVTIGDRVLIGAGAGVGDHLSVGNDCVIASMSGVTGHLAPGSLVGGTPAVPMTLWKDRYLMIGRLKMLYPQMEELKRRLEALEKDGEAG